MNREQFMQELAHQLRRLPREDREAALDYYENYLDDAGPEQESAVLAALGTPKEVAAQIIQEAAEKAIDTSSEGRKRGPFTTVWMVILGICAAPMALPLAAAAVAVLVALLAAVFALMVALVLIVAACGLSGLISLWYGIPLLLGTLSQGLVVTGVGLILLAICILALTGIFCDGGKALRSVAQLISRTFRRGKGAETR